MDTGTYEYEFEIDNVPVKAKCDIVNGKISAIFVIAGNDENSISIYCENNYAYIECNGIDEAEDISDKTKSLDFDNADDDNVKNVIEQLAGYANAVHRNMTSRMTSAKHSFVSARKKFSMQERIRLINETIGDDEEDD